MADKKTKKSSKRRVTEKDFDLLAEYIHEELKRRVKGRIDLDHAIKEIDRQVDMIPDTTEKMIHIDGKNTHEVDPDRAWMPEIELPLQAEALETLSADTRTMVFPDTGPWFAAHGAMTDEYLARADMTSIVAGDQNDVPSKLTQLPKVSSATDVAPFTVP